MASTAVETHLAAERAAPGATVQSGYHREGRGQAWSETAAAEHQEHRHRYSTASVVIEGS